MVPYHLLDEIKAKGDDELSNVKALDAVGFAIRFIKSF